MARKNYPFHKRDVDFGAKITSSLLTGLIVAPFALIDSLENSFSTDTAYGANNKDVTNNKTKFSVSPSSIYQNIVTSIAKEAKESPYNKIQYNVIKEDYYNTITLNKSIEAKRQILYKQLNHYKTKLKWWGIFPKYNLKYTKIIQLILSEISSLENTYIEPVIKLNEVSENNSDCIKISNIYLETNKYIYKGKRLNLADLPINKEKNKNFFKINIAPILSICYDHIELHFYTPFMILMSKSDFVIIDYNCISAEYRVIPIQPISFVSGFKIVNSRWEHSCLNGSPDLRFKSNKKIFDVEIGIIELEIFSQKISLICNQQENASLIYRLISNRKKI